MKRGWLTVAATVALCLSLGVWTTRLQAAESCACEIRQGARQLFVDDWLVDATRHLQRRQGQPVKCAANPILKRDRPWDAARCDLYGSVVVDPDQQRLQLFYAANNVSTGHEDRLAYAESRDGGRTWRKPDLSLVPYQGCLPTNLVLLPPAQNMHGPCVFRDPHETDPDKRYKLFTASYPDTAYLGLPRCYEHRGQFLYSIAHPTLPPHCGRPGMYVAYSPDGLHWNTPPKHVSNMMSDTAQCAFWDARLGKYVAYVRARTANDRSIARMESADFEHWTEPVVVLEGTPKKSLYSMGVNVYGDLYLGTVWIFEPGADDTDRPVIWPELAVSRDGIAWQRPFLGQPLAPCGPPGSPDSRQIRMASSFAVLPDKILLFYGQTDRGHVGDMRVDIGMATLRRDGFAAMTAGAEEGALLTKPLTFPGGRLFVNANVAPGGYVRVELLDQGGAAVADYGRSDAVTGDRLAAPVVWKSQAMLPAARTRPLRLRFLLKDAALYSFWLAP